MVISEIEDTGRDIPPEKIIKEAVTAKLITKGTGLGFLGSYNIIGKHEGNIKIESRSGKGTRFKIKLPI
ncbi:MAG: ATP-binding protein [Candidatus Odinarchaeota archaeon]